MLAGWREQFLSMAEKGPQDAVGWIVFAGLLPLSALYRLVICLRTLAFTAGLRKIYRASVPVISVGNLTAGGTGKTPMVDFLLKRLKQRGVPCAVVSRGYGGSYAGEVGRVNPDSGPPMSPGECGDEPLLLARRNPGVPVFVARRRSLGVAEAEKSGARLILLDDGFQHRAVHRDLDIVLLDGRRPFGNGRLLPAGLLREPLSALNRCHLVIMTRTGEGQGRDLSYSGPVLYSQHSLSEQLVSLDGATISWDDLVGKSCLAFAGIARPSEFFRSLELRGVPLVDVIAFDDHQEYDAALLKRLSQACHSCDLLLTTEKDAVKLNPADLPLPCYQVAIDLVFEDVAPLNLMLDGLLERNENAACQGTP